MRCVESLFSPLTLGPEFPVVLQDASEVSMVAEKGEWDGGMGCGLELL